MNASEFAILASGAYESLLQDHLHLDPGQFALSFKEKNFSPSVLATQLKYLKKSERKLPSYFAHRCLFLPRAFEQASSEATARNRGYSGQTCLDLTCGMGVDSLYFSRKFDQVHALEPDPLLFRLTQHNLTKMGVRNVELFNSKAEAFLTRPPMTSYDFVFIDPDRRSEAGKRLVSLEACSPNILQLYPSLLQLSPTVAIKVSPLFELSEAPALFPTLQKIHIISFKNEIKEIVLELGREDSSSIQTVVQIIRRDSAHNFFFSPLSSSHSPPFSNPEEEGLYIYEPDTAFYKGQYTQALFKDYYPDLPGSMNHEEGYFFSPSRWEASPFPGRVFQVLAKLPPQMGKVKKYLKQNQIRQIHVSKRFFPDSAAKLAKKLRVTAGGDEYLLFTEFPNKDFCAFHVRRLAG